MLQVCCIFAKYKVASTKPGRLNIKPGRLKELEAG